MKNFLLFLIAVLLALIVFPIGFLFTIGRAIWKWKRSKMVGFLVNTCLSFALAIDHFGNVVCRDLFNSLMIKRGGYAFGNIRETISSAIGKNQQRGTLTTTGRCLAWILDTLDPDHCMRSISEV